LIPDFAEVDQLGPVMARHLHTPQAAIGALTWRQWLLHRTYLTALLQPRDDEG
jgi:uncharacterized protein YcaQ